MEKPIPDFSSVANGKHSIRAQYRALREDRSRAAEGWCKDVESLHQHVLSTCPPRAGLSVFAYLSLPEEVDTAPLINAYRTAGGNILVPVIEKAEPMQACFFDDWDDLRAGALGIRRPRKAKTWEQTIDLALVPGLAFTETGDRLGYGGGYYDRWLAAHPEVFRVGLCLDFQLLGHLPSTERDVGMDLLVTNAGAIWTHRRPGFNPARLLPSC